MKKIRGVFERVEDKLAVIKSNGDEFTLPRGAVTTNIGDQVIVTVATKEDDAKSSNEVAKELLREALKEG